MQALGECPNGEVSEIWHDFGTVFAGAVVRRDDAL